MRAASKKVGPQYVTRHVTRIVTSCPDLPKLYGCWQVYFPCWNSSAEIVDWMATRGQGRTQDDFLQLWADYQSTALRTLDEEAGNSNTPIILWSSHLTQPDIIETFLSKDRWGDLLTAGPSERHAVCLTWLRKWETRKPPVILLFGLSNNSVVIRSFLKTPASKTWHIAQWN